MIGFRPRIRALACALLLLASACGARQSRPAAGSVRPQRVTVRMDGPVVEAALDGGGFVPWRSVEAQLAAEAAEDGPDIAVRLRARDTTAANLSAWIEELGLMFGDPVTVEVLRDDGATTEIRLTHSLNRFLEEEATCGQFEAFDDGRRFMIRVRTNAAKQRSPGYWWMRSPKDALPSALTDAMWGSPRPTRMHDRVVCEGPGPAEPCEDVLARSLEEAFRVGVPCKKAFAYLPPRLEWPRLGMVLTSLAELGAGEVMLGLRTEAELRAVIDEPQWVEY